MKHLVEAYESSGFKYVGFADPQVGVHQGLRLYVSEIILRLVDVSKRAPHVFFRNLVELMFEYEGSWESWYQQQRCRGSFATTRTSVKHVNQGCGLLAKVKRAWSITKSTRHIIEKAKWSWIGGLGGSGGATLYFNTLYTSYTLYTLYLRTFYTPNTPHSLCTLYTSHTQGKRESSQRQKGNGKARQSQRGKGKGGRGLLGSNSTGQPDRAHARTKRNETIPRLDSPPTSD